MLSNSSTVDEKTGPVAAASSRPHHHYEYFSPSPEEIQMKRSALHGRIVTAASLNLILITDNNNHA